MAALASDWLRHFWLLLWNRWTEFNETWQEVRSLCPLASLCFSGRSEKQDGRPGLWLGETFSTSPLKPLNGIQRNLTGSKISMSSTKFVFSGRSEKHDGRPGLWLAETFLTSPLKPLNGIWRNLTGRKISTSSTKFVFFRPIGKTKWPSWPIHQKGGTLYSGARYVALWASCLNFDYIYTTIWCKQRKLLNHSLISHIREVINKSTKINSKCMSGRSIEPTLTDFQRFPELKIIKVPTTQPWHLTKVRD